MFFGTVGNAQVNVADKARTLDGVEAVDLGLSVKWANMNVGAEKDSGFGTYFAWGETKPKEYYSWGTYVWRLSWFPLTMLPTPIGVADGACPPWTSTMS